MAANTTKCKKVDQRLTREHSFNVPGHYSIEHGVKQHEADGCGQVVAVLLQRAGQKVGPLDAHPLLLKQGKILTAKTESHWREQTLGREKMKERLTERKKVI